jgi:predicted RNA-binding protein with PUA-like domain
MLKSASKTGGPVSNYWLMKTEPDVFSIDHLARDKTTWWEGVRNYSARNFMKAMQIGDLVLFYHSSTEPPGVAGICRVTKLAEADQSQFNKKSPYYDEAASPDKPRWFCVQVAFIEKFPRLVSLEEIKKTKGLQNMVLLKNSRLSVQPVSEKEFNIIKAKA